MQEGFVAPKAGTLLLIALTAVGLASSLGGLTNAINGAVSPYYFRTIMRWYDVQQIWRASVAQGIFEGLIYGAVFAFVFTLVLGIASKAHVTYLFALRHLLLAGGIALTAWGIGGILGMGLACLSPDFYRNTFIGVPTDFSQMLCYAWVGGSIWGVMFGTALSGVIASVVASVVWRRTHRVLQIGSGKAT
jgi:hypothetical protein